MKSPKTFLLLSIVVAVLVLGIAYAAIQDITLTVNGSATASPDQANFEVKFTGTPTVKPVGDSNGSGTLVIDEGSLTATMNVSGFKKVGDTVQAVIEITNNSTDLKTTLVATPSAIAEKLGAETLNASEYFKLTKVELATTSLEAGASTTLTIEVQLVKVPVSADVTGTFNVSVVASPVNA